MTSPSVYNFLTPHAISDRLLLHSHHEYQDFFTKRGRANQWENAETFELMATAVSGVYLLAA